MRCTRACAVATRVFCSLAFSVSTFTVAEQSQMPPMDMPAVNDRAPPPAPRPESPPPSASSHAPEPSLERPAASAAAAPTMMPGMDMDDAERHHFVWLEHLEGVTGSESGGAWDTQAWFGGDFDKLWLKSEGDRLAGRTDAAKVEALWAHAVLPFWDTQLGLRHDWGVGPTRNWVAFGAQGISAYRLDVELTGYVGDEGRSAARVKGAYDMYVTQRLVLKPEIELNAYGKPDRARNLGAGLSDGQFELRLRYEFTRRLAPYAGYVYARRFGDSALLARATHDAALDHRVVAGMALFF